MSSLSSRLDALIAHLHRAAMDRAGWQDFVLALEAELPGARASLHVVSMQDGAQFISAAGGYDPSFGASYLEHYHKLNPYLPFAATAPLGRARLAQADISDEAVMRTEFYNDWLLPQGDLRSAVAIKLRPFQGRTLRIPVHVMARTSEQTLPRAMRLLNRLEPHLSHALAVSETISALAMQALGRGGMIVLDRDRRLVWADEGAWALERHLFRLDVRDRIRFNEGRVQDWLTRLAGRIGHGLEDGAPAIAAESGWQIRAVRPEGDLAPSLVLGTLAPIADRIVLVLSPPPRPASDGVLRLRFGLTRAEAGIAMAIGEGQSTAEMAEAAGVSRHTIRNQVRAVLHKTGARNRADVARIVAELARPA